MALKLEASEANYKGFSCPQENLDEEFFRHVAITSARADVHEFIEKCSSRVESCGHGVVKLIANWLDQDSTFETVWDLAFGEARLATQGNNQLDLLPSAANLALRISEFGFIGEWGLKLTVPARLRWGEWLLPQAEHLVVSSDGTLASIKTRCGTDSAETRLRLRTGVWEVESGERLPQFTIEQRKVNLLSSAAVPCTNLESLRSLMNDGSTDRMLDQCKAAVELVTLCAPVYLKWIARVLRHVIPLQNQENKMLSGGTDYPGCIYMSYFDDLIMFAETLIHEATHQYMNLICRLSDIDDGTDTALYYSPFRRMNRPIHAIVIAYHAFANVMLFYRLCHESGRVDSDYCLSQEKTLLLQLKQLEVALRGTRVLTPVGRALWEPLAPRVNCTLLTRQKLEA